MPLLLLTFCPTIIPCDAYLPAKSIGLVHLSKDPGAKLHVLFNYSKKNGTAFEFKLDCVRVGTFPGFYCVYTCVVAFWDVPFSDSISP